MVADGTEQNDGTNPNNPGAGAPNADNDQKFKALVDAEVEKRTAGLMKNKQEILDEKRKDQEELKKWRGLDDDYEVAKSKVDFVNQNEDAQLLKDGKVEELFQKRVAQMEKKQEAERSARDTRIAELEADNTRQKSVISEKFIDGAIRDASIKAGVTPTAISDVLLNARLVFTLDESNQVVPQDSSQNPIYGADGKSPMSPTEWLESKQASNPHWWGNTEGGGASGGGAGAGKERYSREAWNMKMAQATPDDRKELGRRAAAKEIVIS